MSRQEFPKSVKRDALKRSGMRCEAFGSFYGLLEGERCNATLEKGVEFDHIIADGIGGEPTLDNCAAVCRVCHRFKTDTRDTPLAAKVKRVSDRHLGIKRTSRPMPGSRNSPFKIRMNGEVVRR